MKEETIKYYTDIEQNTPEWHLFKNANFSASEFHKLVGAKGLTQGSMSYIEKKLGEFLSGTYDEVDSKAMAWGREHEPVAGRLLEKAMGVNLLQIGGITNSFYPNTVISPDRISETNFLNPDVFGVEIKCPMTLGNHACYIPLLDSSIKDKGSLLKKINSDYYWQVQGSMLISGIKQWYFVSYQPFFTAKKDLRLIVAKIEFNQKDCDLLAERLEQANEVLNELIEIALR